MMTKLNEGKEEKNENIYGPEDLATQFDTMAYLKDFYAKVDDPAMQMMLIFLPNIVARMNKFDNLLDFGAGPTIHTAVAFRKKAENIFLADYLETNRQELMKWLNGTSQFDWTVTLQKITSMEGINFDEFRSIENFTRQKIRGIFKCDCHRAPSVEAALPVLGNFDVVVTIFCIEYCCSTIEEYKQAVKNAVDQVKPGGTFIMGSILRDTWCSFGNRKFFCLYVTEENMKDALRESGLSIDDCNETVYYNVNDMVLLSTRKRL